MRKSNIYIRLECARSLLLLSEKDSVQFFEKMLNDEYLANQLECVITLSEVETEESIKLLIHTLLDSTKDVDIRAGAAWALGELKNKDTIDILINVFDAEEKNIRIEAARALMKLNEKFTKDTIKYLSISKNDQQRAGISWSLSKSSNFTVHDLIEVMNDENKEWIAWIIGTQNEKDFIAQIEELKSIDTEVYFAVTVLWKVLSSWVNGLKIY